MVMIKIISVLKEVCVKDVDGGLILCIVLQVGATANSQIFQVACCFGCKSRSGFDP